MYVRGHEDTVNLGTSSLSSSTSRTHASHQSSKYALYESFYFFKYKVTVAACTL